MTPHNRANLNDIAKTVIMAGDPLRIKNIADKYLENKKLVNDIRGMYAYTGTYKNHEVTLMAHGMGMPSAGIYVYELFKYYNVEKIIRIGTCGTNNKNINIFDIILVDKSYTESNYAYTLNNEHINLITSSNVLNKELENSANKLNIKLTKGDIITSDCFDWYITNINESIKRIPSYLDIIATEMEAFAIFYIAKMFNKEASCLLTVVDSHLKKEKIDNEEKEKTIDQMTLIALESLLNQD